MPASSSACRPRCTCTSACGSCPTCPRPGRPCSPCCSSSRRCWCPWACWRGASSAGCGPRAYIGDVENHHIQIGERLRSRAELVAIEACHRQTGCGIQGIGDLVHTGGGFGQFDGAEIRIDRSSIGDEAIRTLRIGQRVKFDLEEKDGERLARDLRIVTFE